MGIKIKSLLAKTTLVCAVVLFNAPVRAAFVPYIPTATMQIAKEAEIRTAQTVPLSEVVRVGISDIGFKNYDYNEITLYGTDTIEIYDNNNLIGTFPAEENIHIKFESGMYTIFRGNNTVLDEVVGPVTFTSPKGLLGVKNLKRASKPALYHGAFQLLKKNDKRFNLVNLIEVEDYLKGVVPNEMPVRFGLEALKAQSVAARNYVLSPRTKSSHNYDVVDSVASQVYYGASTENQLSNQAVHETTGIVALYNWELILALYSSTAGGYTESYSYAFSDPVLKAFPSEGKPYLLARPDILSQTPLNTEEAASEYYKSKPDSYDIRSPYFRWEREWTADELKKALETTLPGQSAAGFVKPVFNKGDKLDALKEIVINKRGDSGKIVEMEIVTESQNIKVFKELVIRRAVTKDGKALPSANVVFENNKDEFGNLVSVKAYGGGFGHGVGLSQFGAGFMGSELKLPYEKILQHYYSGITLGTKPVIVSSDVGQRAVTQHFYSNDKKARLIVDNKYQVSKLIADINGREVTFDLPKSILPAKRICDIDISKYINKGINTITFFYPMEEGDKKGLRLYVEVVKSDVGDYIW